MVPITHRPGSLRAAGWLQAGAALLLLAGCAAPAMPTPVAIVPEAGGRTPKSVAMQHYTLPMGDISSGGTAIVRHPPVYPAALLAACPEPVQVRARVSVDGTGRVRDVRSVLFADPATTASWQPFLLAIRAAAMEWRFNPLQVTHWAADADGNSHVVDSKNEPFDRTYVFRFACHARKPVVGVAEAGTQ